MLASPTVLVALLLSVFTTVKASAAGVDDPSRPSE